MPNDGVPRDPDPAPRTVELARLIQQHVDRFVADDRAEPEDLASFLDELPRRERATVVGEVFASLSSERQWEVLVAVFGDKELAEHLEVERRRRLDWLAGEASLASLVESSRATGAVDLAALPAGTEVVLGLFRSGDVAAAADRGAQSDVCARRLVLRVASTDGVARVIEDSFNPRGGLFVTPDYDVSVWQGERWPSHSLVRVGAAGTGEDAKVEPVLFAGARVDVGFEGAVHRGRLHLGFVVIGGHDVFTGAR